MASSIDLTEDWADGTYTFRLGVAQLEEHDDKLKMGPVAVLGALMDGIFRYGHIRDDPPRPDRRRHLADQCREAMPALRR